VAREKRRTARGPVSATMVLLHDQQSLGSHRVLNLSGGGALLVGRAPANRPKDLEVLVRLSTGRVVRAGAIIVREESVEDSSVFALEFTKMSAEDQAAIDALVLTAVEDERDPTALIIASDADLGQRLRRQLNGLGHRAFDVSTLADAMTLLGAPNAVSVAVIQMGAEAALMEEALEQLAEQHPQVRRILIESPWTRESLARALAAPATDD
jgi:hypothetical protein